MTYEEQAECFFNLFRGSPKSRGVWCQETNKASTERGSGTLEHVKDHLNGKIGYGQVPFVNNTHTKWGVIDIDCHGNAPDINLVELENRARSKEFPVVICRSKSGGAHVYFFTEEPIPAATIRKLLTRWANELGFGGAEIFPKQDELTDNQLGNWINLPYFGGKNTNRFAVIGGKAATLEFFLEICHEYTIPISDIDKLFYGKHAEAPPCVQAMVQNTVSGGNRNTALYNYGVFAKKAFDSGMVTEACKEFNALCLVPPLKTEEAIKCIRSATRRDYKYKCKEEPCKSLCKSSKCVNQKFGIDEQQQSENQLGEATYNNLRQIGMENPKYILTINGVDIELTSAQLNNHTKLRDQATKRLQQRVPKMKAIEWDVLLNALLSEAQVIMPPDEAETNGMLVAALRNFVYANMSGSRDGVLDALENSPVMHEIDNKPVLMFTPQQLVLHLMMSKVKIPETGIWPVFHHLLKHTTVQVMGRKTNVWYYEISEDEIPKDYDIKIPKIDTEF